MIGIAVETAVPILMYSSRPARRNVKIRASSIFATAVGLLSQIYKRKERNLLMRV
jgi:hypothetical protein